MGRGEGQSGVADDQMIDVVAEGQWHQDGIKRMFGREFCEGLLDLCDSGVFWAGRECVQLFGGAAQPERRVFQVQIDHAEASHQLEELGVFAAGAWRRRS